MIKFCFSIISFNCYLEGFKNYFISNSFAFWFVLNFEKFANFMVFAIYYELCNTVLIYLFRN